MPAHTTSSRTSSPSAAPGVAEVKLSATARRDLAGIDAHSAEEFGDKVADKYSRGMNEAFAMLPDVPFAGEPRPDYGKGARCKVFGSHRIVYRVEGEIVYVQRILHHAQDVRANLKQ